MTGDETENETETEAEIGIEGGTVKEIAGGSGWVPRLEARGSEEVVAIVVVKWAVLLCTLSLSAQVGGGSKGAFHGAGGPRQAEIKWVVWFCSSCSI